jgi:hypothetical protein
MFCTPHQRNAKDPEWLDVMKLKALCDAFDSDDEVSSETSPMPDPFYFPSMHHQTAQYYLVPMRAHHICVNAAYAVSPVLSDASEPQVGHFM